MDTKFTKNILIFFNCTASFKYLLETGRADRVQPWESFGIELNKIYSYKGTTGFR